MAIVVHKSEWLLLHCDTLLHWKMPWDISQAKAGMLLNAKGKGLLHSQCGGKGGPLWQTGPWPHWQPSGEGVPEMHYPGTWQFLQLQVQNGEKGVPHWPPGVPEMHYPGTWQPPQLQLNGAPHWQPPGGKGVDEMHHSCGKGLHHNCFPQW